MSYWYFVVVLNFSKKELLGCDYTMAGVQTEKLALQMTVNFHRQLARPGWVAPPAGSLHHHHSTSYTHLQKTLPSITCTFYTQSRCIFDYSKFMIFNQPTTVWHELKTYWVAGFTNSLYLYTKQWNKANNKCFNFIYFQSLQRFFTPERCPISSSYSKLIQLKGTVDCNFVGN